MSGGLRTVELETQQVLLGLHGVARPGYGHDMCRAKEGTEQNQEHLVLGVQGDQILGDGCLGGPHQLLGK
jgi:hypothetical protein